jgi:hypothetical protein
MATLYERLPIAPDPSLQEPAGESELDSLSHRPVRPDPLAAPNAPIA